MYENSSHKISRSRSQRLKGESDSTVINLYRKKPLFIPKTIRFVRGTSTRTRQAFLDENNWIKLDEPLSQLITHESTMINDFHYQHVVPSLIESSAQAFLFEFERENVNLENKHQTESLRSFCVSFGSIFSAHVTLFLLYESEMHFAEMIKANPLRNSPAMYILRFLYSFPSLMKNEPTNTQSAVVFQEHLHTLIKFASSNSKYFFVLPSAVVSTQAKSGNSRVVVKLK